MEGQDYHSAREHSIHLPTAIKERAPQKTSSLALNEHLRLDYIAVPLAGGLISAAEGRSRPEYITIRP